MTPNAAVRLPSLNNWNPVLKGSPDSSLVVSDEMLLHSTRDFAHEYGVKWTHEGPATPTKSPFGELVGEEDYLRNSKIEWACTSCGQKYPTREGREIHHADCSGKYEAEYKQEQNSNTTCSLGTESSADLDVALTLQVCVVPTKTHDWLVHLSWLRTFIADPRVVSIVIYSSMKKNTALEYGISHTQRIKLNCGRYLLHMVHDVLNRKDNADAILFCSGIPFEYLREGYKPQDLLNDALGARCGHLKTFEGSEMWYYTQRERGIHPKVRDRLKTYGAVWDEMFETLGIQGEHKDILAHPGGNIFALKSADINFQDSNNALRKLWNLYQTYLDRASPHAAGHPTVKEVLALCWGSIFGDKKGYMPDTVDPDGKRLAVYGQKCVCTIILKTFDLRDFMYQPNAGMEMQKRTEPPSPSIGILVSSKVNGLALDKSLIIHPNTFRVIHAKFDEAPAIINTEMKPRPGDGTFLCYLRYIIQNYEDLPDIILFLEHHHNTGLDSYYESHNIMEDILQAQAKSEGFMIPKGITIRRFEFNDWPETSESSHSAIMYRFFAEQLNLNTDLPDAIDSLSESTFSVTKEMIRNIEKSTWQTLFNVVIERGIYPSFRSLANRFWPMIFSPEEYIIRHVQDVYNTPPGSPILPSYDGHEDYIDRTIYKHAMGHSTPSSPALVPSNYGIRSMGSSFSLDQDDKPTIVKAALEIPKGRYRYNPIAAPNELTAFSLDTNF